MVTCGLAVTGTARRSKRACVIERAYASITRLLGGEKTTLAETVLREHDGPTVAVRCERDIASDERVPVLRVRRA